MFVQPSLKLFCVCGGVIVADDGSVSIITLLERIEMTTVGDDDANIIFAPLKWHTLSLWRRAADQSQQTFKVRTQVFAGGTLVENMTGYVDIDFADKQNFRINQPHFGFPIARSGNNDFVISILSEDGEWTERGRYPIEVICEPAKVTSTK